MALQKAFRRSALYAVTIGVGPNRAPWRCLVKRGNVAEFMSLTDEGKL